MECLECGKKLNKKNKCGYCYEHRRLSPYRKKWDEEYRQTKEFKERARQRDKKRYYEGKRDKKLKEYKERNRIEINERRKEDRKRNPKKYKEYEKRKSSKESRRQWQKEYLKKRRKDPKFYLSMNFSGSMRRALRGNKGGYHWEELVEYNLQDLTEHLEKVSNYTIEEYLKGDLHIDHIIPINAYSFNSYEDEDFKKCWSLRNLRIIKAGENCKKQNMVDKKLIEEFEIQDLLPEDLEI